MIDACSLEPTPLLPLEDALLKIKDTIQPITTETVINLYDAPGRVLSKTLLAPINLPFDRNAAMDGYALSSADLVAENSFTLTLAGTAWAGKPYLASIKRGQCLRIFTGAVVPDVLDTVIMQEQVVAVGKNITFPAGLKPYQNVRAAGEDIKQGEVLCQKGKKLNSADIGLLAAAGISHLPVYDTLNIACFSSGDELVSIGKPLASGQIYDSNRYMLAGLLADPRYVCVDLGIISDDPHELSNNIKQAAQTNNVIISTGGASVGEADFIQDILGKLGKVYLWKIAVKPGKPLIFGKIGDCYYFGLPGNPVSMMVIFQQVVLPALTHLSGADSTRPLQLCAICTTNLKKSPGRLEFQRGILSQSEDGQFYVASAGKQGSHILSSMSRSNCYIILPIANKGVNAGDTVIVEPFNVTLP